MLDQRGRLLRAAVGFAGCSMPSYDRALWALRTWLDSWSSIGHVAVGMHRQLRVSALVLVSVVACASPATTTRDASVVGEEPPPRFAPGGPDAEELGASMGYPNGGRNHQISERT